MCVFALVLSMSWSTEIILQLFSLTKLMIILVVMIVIDLTCVSRDTLIEISVG